MLKKQEIKEEKPLTEQEKIDNINKDNKFFQIVSNKKSNEIIRKNTDKTSDKIIQNILNASKLFEGRFTFDYLINLDIPSFEKLIDNEFANIDRSYKEFKEKGIINAYTKHETTNIDDKFIKDLKNSTLK